MAYTITPGTGTISIANGATDFAGTGSNFTIFGKGTVINIGGFGALQVASDPTSDTAGAAVLPWAWGDVVDQPYEIWKMPEPAVYSERVRQLLEKLQALSGTGLSVGGFGNFADRSGFDDEAADFVFMSLDGDGGAFDTPVIFIKATATSGDWSAAIAFTGPQGAQGDPGLIGDWKGAWATGTDYAVDDAVQEGGSGYICVTAHTAGTFADDLAAGKWDLVASKGDQGMDGTTLTSLGLKNGQTDATLQVRKAGNSIEFGHTNPAGYGSTIGAEAGNGKPFVAYNAEAGTDSNTYRTRGFKGFVTRGNLAGGIDFLTVPNANADNQAPALLGGISSTGVLSGLTVTRAQVSDLTPLYVGFYNGQSDYTTPANTYNIGVLTASDPLAFGRKDVLAPVWDDATAYLDSSGHQNPHPIRVGDEIWVYYEGYDGARKRIFMLRTDLYGNLREKPLMPVIDYTEVTGANSIDRPAVLYDPSDATWPFKMVLSKATSGTNPTALVAAHSADGFSWTTIGEIANVASGAAWENTYIETTGRLLKDGSTYRLFYSGHNGTFWQSGEMHSTDFATWTKNAANPLLAPRGGYLQALTADTVAGTKTIKVANSALFDVGAPIALCETGSGTSFQTNRIAAIPDGTTLTTLETIQGNYATTLPSAVSQITGRSVEFSELWKEDGVWKALIVGFQFIKAGQVIETMAYAEGPADLSAAFTIHPAEWPLPLIEKRKVWDQRSAENLKFVRVQ